MCVGRILQNVTPRNQLKLMVRVPRGVVVLSHDKPPREELNFMKIFDDGAATPAFIPVFEVY
jgi:hypothetical protein